MSNSTNPHPKFGSIIHYKGEPCVFINDGENGFTVAFPNGVVSNHPFFEFDEFKDIEKENELIETLISAINKVNNKYSTYINDKHSYIWTERDGEVFWNIDNSEVDLLDRDGLTFSGVIDNDPETIGSYTLVNIDTGTDVSETVIFKTSNRIWE